MFQRIAPFQFLDRLLGERASNATRDGRCRRDGEKALRFRERVEVARIATVLCTSHSPWLFVGADDWARGSEERYRDGKQRPKVPSEPAEVSAEKHARCMRAFATLREHVASVRPDALLIFGDDQEEQFTFTNFPAFNLFVGDAFAGYKISKYFGIPRRGERPVRPKTSEHWTTVPGQPELGRALMTALIERGFDLSFSTQLGDPEFGMGHAIMRPTSVLTPAYDVPVLPFLVNCYYGPAPRGRRCYELGLAVREAIESIPLDLRIAIVGSGGLWHMLNDPEPIVDEAFDARILDAVRMGDARAMAAGFDDRSPVYDRNDAESLERASNGTGMVLGYGGGTGEVRNWIAAAAVADGRPGTVVDYIPIYQSPIGVAFAYWENV